MVDFNALGYDPNDFLNSLLLQMAQQQNAQQQLPSMPNAPMPPLDRGPPWAQRQSNKGLIVPDVVNALQGRAGNAPTPYAGVPADTWDPVSGFFKARQDYLKTKRTTPFGRLVQGYVGLPDDLLDIGVGAAKGVADPVQYFFTGKRLDATDNPPDQTGPKVDPRQADIDAKSKIFAGRGNGVDNLTPTADTVFTMNMPQAPDRPQIDPSKYSEAIQNIIKGLAPGQVPGAPTFVAPDFSAARAKYEAAKPQEQQVTQDATTAGVLSSLLKGLAGGSNQGVGRMLLGGGAGAYQGVSDVEQQKMAFKAANAEANQRWNQAGVGFESGIAKENADVSNKNVAARHDTAMEQYKGNEAYKRIAASLGGDLAGALQKADTENANIKWENDKAKLPTAVIQGDKIVTKTNNPDGSMKLEVKDITDVAKWARIMKLTGGLGGGLGGGTSGAPTGFRKDAAWDMSTNVWGHKTPEAMLAYKLILNGQGPALLGKAWDSTMKEVQTEVQRLGITGAGATDEVQARMLMKLVNNISNTPGMYANLAKAMGMTNE